MPYSVAIIGAGPSGFYTAEALLKSSLDYRIDLIEGLPTPFGLVRFGVAPDHQSTKRVARTYDRTAADEAVRYYGNVEVGRDVRLEELRSLYDAVVVAVGAPLDRELKIPGGDKPGVYGSAAFVGWYNGHPAHRDLAPDLDTDSVAIIGNGNVALDIARVLVKTPAEMATTDLPDYAAEVLHSAPVRDVYLIGRRGPLDSKFTNVELREMARLEDCVPLVDPGQLPEGPAPEAGEREQRLQAKNLDTLRGFAGLSAAGKRKRVHFKFFSRPLEVLGGDRVEALRLEKTRVEAGHAVGTGETFDLQCGAVMAAIGTRAQPLEGIPFDRNKGVVTNRHGRVAKGLYVVGWARRGPTGVIGTNKPDADEIARHIETDLAGAQTAKPGRVALEDLLDERGAAWIGYDGWKEIEAAEVDAAAPGMPRKKLSRVAEMLAVLDRSGRSARRRAD
ncbi:FAD-dependent oxidoreductase [Pelagibius litoralis]|uniref:FAD-dependent oxidoreductase n=1 Tax=Pelagibius litoralis TaxID=374515 RepID=A0A967C8X9_9PROT|nr:FAD-dependent oxidoreductase [Pelagibius litoralis]NIA68937.1 FAD-dependent oxidoreductase [Pelagibius litoralis]